MTGVIDLDALRIERIEADLDALAGQMRRGFEEAIVQQEGGVAADQAVDAMKEEAAQVGGGGKLTDPIDVALPAQQGRGLERAVLAAVVDGFGVERSQEPLADGTEEALDLAASFGLVGWSMHDEDADGSGDARRARSAPPGSGRSWRCPCRDGWGGRARRRIGGDSRGRNPGPGPGRTGRAGSGGWHRRG